MGEPSVDPRKLEELLVYCLDFAKEMLQGHGEFHPFGAVIGAGGKLNAVGGYAGEGAPGPQVFKLLADAFKAQFAKGEILAAAIAANVNIPAEFEPKFPDGIRVLVECPGYSRFV